MKQVMEYVSSFFLFALIITGLIGISYNLFREGGWVEYVFGGIWGATMRSPIMGIAVLAGVAYFAYRKWINRKVRRNEGNAGTIVFYVMVAAGVYFLGRLFVVGSF